MKKGVWFFLKTVLLSSHTEKCNEAQAQKDVTHVYLVLCHGGIIRDFFGGKEDDPVLNCSMYVILDDLYRILMTQGNSRFAIQHLPTYRHKDTQSQRTTRSSLYL